MRAPSVLILAALVAGLALRPTGAEEQKELSPEDLFKWGEYDSLIRSLEPVLASLSAGATARGDSLELARSNLWLGVAYWATEKRALAEQAFVRACRLDQGLVMDRLYATPEILASFETIVAREREARRSAIAAAALVPAAPRPPVPSAAKPWHGKGWAIGALTAVGLAAGGTYVYLATRKDPDEILVDPKNPPPQ